ncbi:hypothetical protein IEQ34_013732 [Dendrobium chrysotoxum]|uniref:Uncharacterized protein n=1 Tax=Dendrobium chrysotoxum TaxID=161865 RepID=A0AAV7GS54_DENCH|nr:hypothetical protein IEQ34_013732 [Dendrobium chrysotoxum]
MESLQSYLLSPPPKEARQSANFHPSVWTDFFISRPPLPDINMLDLFASSLLTNARYLCVAKIRHCSNQRMMSSKLK